MTIDNSRRSALLGFGALAVGAAAIAAGRSRAATTDMIIPPGARELAALTERLRRAPRRRDFKTVPMILDPRSWDAAALRDVITYGGGPKQAWDHTEHGPWLNLMRNSLNTQIWAWKQADFLVVSATHGSAHLALLDEAMWQKYQLGKLSRGRRRRTWRAAGRGEERPERPGSRRRLRVLGQQHHGAAAPRRRVHRLPNADWEVSEKLIKRRQSRSRLDRGDGGRVHQPSDPGRRAEPGHRGHAAGAATRRKPLCEMTRRRDAAPSPCLPVPPALQRPRRLSPAANGGGAPAAQPGDEIFPPWQHGDNNDALDTGLDFTIPEIDDLADFHGDVMNPALVLYVGGHYFAMAPLVAAFGR